MMLRLLHVKGYEVLIAHHGGEALSCLELYSVDLVIMVSFIFSFEA
jgi:DNA-binding response OmpR family regulator